MVVAGVGVDHDTLVEAAQRHFVDQRPVWETEGGVAEVQTDRSIAQYTGGIVSREKDLSDVSLGPTPMPELGHIVIGLQLNLIAVQNYYLSFERSRECWPPAPRLHPLLRAQHDDGWWRQLLRRRTWQGDVHQTLHQGAQQGAWCFTLSHSWLIL